MDEPNDDTPIKLSYVFGFTTPPAMQPSDRNVIAYGADSLLVIWDWKVLVQRYVTIWSSQN